MPFGPSAVLARPGPGPGRRATECLPCRTLLQPECQLLRSRHDRLDAARLGPLRAVQMRLGLDDARRLVEVMHDPAHGWTFGERMAAYVDELRRLIRLDRAIFVGC